MNTLKKLVLFMLPLLFIVLLSSCDGQYQNRNNGKVKYRQVTIDSCQYLGFETVYDYMVYTHKGNCNNPIHRGK